MSFQDVGKPGARRGPSSAGGPPSSKAGAFSSATAVASGGIGGRGGRAGAVVAPNNNSAVAAGAGGAINLGGYEQVSDAIVQYQRNVALLEKMARNVGTPNDTSILQTQ
jgi:hypothetical protein